MTTVSSVFNILDVKDIAIIDKGQDFLPWCFVIHQTLVPERIVLKIVIDDAFGLPEEGWKKKHHNWINVLNWSVWMFYLMLRSKFINTHTCGL